MKCKPCQQKKLESIITQLKQLDKETKLPDTSKTDNYKMQLHAVEHYTENGKLYLKTFLINDKRNNNGWRASWDSIRKNVKSFIGQPGIEYYKCGEYGCMRDHTDEPTLEENLKLQENYRVSTIVDVVLDEGTHTAYAIHRIENEDFAAKINRKEIKYLSPSIWPNKEKTTVYQNADNNEWYIDTTDWKGVHDAWVDNPAFGHAARIVGQCFGGEDCIVELKGDKLLVGRKITREELLTARILLTEARLREIITFGSK